MKKKKKEKRRKKKATDIIKNIYNFSSPIISKLINILI